MKLDDGEARRRFTQSRVARLATTDASGQPHLVPVVFAVVHDTLYSAVDAKPKSTTNLRRLANVRANPRVSLLADHYADDDWAALWWARADGVARVLTGDEPEGIEAVAALAARYAQYREQQPGGPVLAVDVRKWSGWSASTTPG
jgi:PPOX class probable F420-dependent enzyme